MSPGGAIKTVNQKV